MAAPSLSRIRVSVSHSSPELGFRLPFFGDEGAVVEVCGRCHSGFYPRCCCNGWCASRCVSEVKCRFVRVVASSTFCSHVAEPEDTMVCRFVVAELRWRREAWSLWLLQRWCERGGVRSEMNGGGGSGKMDAVATGENEEVRWC